MIGTVAQDTGLGRPVRVLYLTPSLNRGGIETYLLRFLRYLNATNERWKHGVMCLSGCGGALESSFREVGADVALFRAGWRRPWGYVQLFRFLRRGQYDAVCDFGDDLAGMTMWLARLAGVPTRVVWYRGWKPLYRQTLLRRGGAWLMRRLVGTHATWILSNSRACLDRRFGCCWETDPRFAVIYNGIPDLAVQASPAETERLRAELGIPSGKIVVGHVGRFDKAKNYRMIAAVAKGMTRRKRDDVVFLLVGRGVPEGIVGYLNGERGDNIIACGERNDIPRVLSLLDGFFFPSVTEGQPNALLEAMLSGIPFVASDIPPIAECVPSPLRGWLADPRDEEAMLAKVIEMVDRRKEFRRRLAEQIPFLRRRHDPSECFGRFAACLRGPSVSCGGGQG